MANAIGYLILARPSFVLGGRAIEIVDQEDDSRRYIRTAVEARPGAGRPGRSFSEDAIEVDVDCISDGEFSDRRDHAAY